jgi:hypothetical protein
VGFREEEQEAEEAEEAKEAEEKQERGPPIRRALRIQRQEHEPARRRRYEPLAAI